MICLKRGCELSLQSFTSVVWHDLVKIRSKARGFVDLVILFTHLITLLIRPPTDLQTGQVQGLHVVGPGPRVVGAPVAVDHAHHQDGRRDGHQHARHHIGPVPH